ncbi:MAG: SGNH/GDSL hydrolase family protein [Aquabacterium sp.]|nr:SGNH/GDSL hydrolase family protein [Aquabacterium sp.]
MFRFAAHPQSKTPRLRQIGLVALACSVLIVSGCGGGNRKKEYMPERIVSFGDENSAMTTGNASGTTIQGLVYTVNNLVSLNSISNPIKYCLEIGDSAACASNSAAGLISYVAKDLPGVTPPTPTTSLGLGTGGATFDGVTQPNFVTFTQIGNGTYLSIPSNPSSPQTQADTKRTWVLAYSCASNSIWTQVIAHGFGKGYQTACPLEANGNAVTYAVYGAKVAGLTAQVAQADLRDGTLVTIMAGQNDILEQYEAAKVGTITEAQAIAELEARAEAMANMVINIINTGSKVVLALTPDLGKSPKGAATGENSTMLTTLTTAFNNRLTYGRNGSRTWPGAGRSITTVDASQVTRGLVGVVDGVALCDPAKAMRPDGTFETAPDLQLQYCTNLTSNFVANGSAATYMWADSTHFATLGHVQIGSAGLSRAANQF